jgi:hypothetical protein
MVFQRPEWLWGSVLIPLILLGAWYAYQKRKRVLANPWIQMHLRGSILPKRRVIVTRWILYCVVYLLFLMVLAEPMKKKIQEKPIFTGIRITFLLDTSLSMAYARDLEPNRLAVAKKTLQNLVAFLWNNEEIGSNYQVAVIPFAGAAFPTSFLFSTSPYEIISYIQAVDENTIDVPGTSLQAVIIAWEDLLSRFPADSDTIDVGILISDGGKEGDSEQNRLEAIRRINDLHTKNPRVLLYTVGIGKIKEDALGIRHAEEVLLVKSQDEKGHVVSYYRTNPDDPTSSIQTSSLDEEILRRMAAVGGGSYYYVEESSIFYTSLKSIILSQRKIVRSETYEEYTPLRTWFLVPLLGAFSCLAGYGRWILIPFRKVSGHSRYPS